MAHGSPIRKRFFVMTDTITHNKPTPAFIGASWLALTIGVATYLIGLFNSPMELNEMGYYFTVLVLGLYGAISLQKTPLKIS